MADGDSVRPSEPLDLAKRRILAKAAAGVLRRRGPMPHARVIELLCARGVTRVQAESVIVVGLGEAILANHPTDAKLLIGGRQSLLRRPKG